MFYLVVNYTILVIFVKIRLRPALPPLTQDLCLTFEVRMLVSLGCTVACLLDRRP
jgi:hypothetical protein